MNYIQNAEIYDIERFQCHELWGKVSDSGTWRVEVKGFWCGVPRTFVGFGADFEAALKRALKESRTVLYD